MQTKTIALVITLSALSIVLNPTISKLAIPAPFLLGTNLVFQFFEIPVVIAFLLMGIKPGLTVAVINSVAMVFIYPGRTFLYPLGNLCAVTSVIVGVYVATKLYSHRTHTSQLTGNRIILYSTTSGVLFRVAVMGPWWIASSFFVGSIPIPAILSGVLPVEVFYNAILALYTIPISYVIAKTINQNLRISQTTTPEVQTKKCP